MKYSTSINEYCYSSCLEPAYHLVSIVTQIVENKELAHLLSIQWSNNEIHNVHLKCLPSTLTQYCIEVFITSVVFLWLNQIYKHSTDHYCILHVRTTFYGFGTLKIHIIIDSVPAIFF